MSDERLFDPGPAVPEVRAKHAHWTMDDEFGELWCAECGEPWPCPTWGDDDG